MSVKNSHRDEIREALDRQRAAFFSVGAFSAVINLLMLAPALYMLQVYDRVLSSGNGFTLLMLTVLVVGLYGLMGLLEWVRGLLVIRIGEGLDQTLSSRVYDAGFEHQLAGGPLPAGQAMSDLNQVRQFLTGSAVFAFFDAPWAPLYLLVLFLFDAWLGGLALLGALLLVALAFVNERWSRAPLKAASEHGMQASKLVDEQTRNAEVAVAMGMLGAVRQRWQQRQMASIDEHHRASERSVSVNAVTRSLRIALQSFMLGTGAWLVLDGQITGGMMVAGSILVGRMLAPVEQLVGAWRQWSGTRLAWQRLSALLASHPVREAGLVLPDPAGDLTVEGLMVVPPGTNLPTLTRVDFQLQAGQILGVLGASGCGKSSLARTLTGIWSPRSGKVRLDGADLHGWDRQALGPWLGYLPQDVSLFAGTVAENIARFGPVEHDKVVAAAQLARVHELILRLPQGYDTVLGVDGSGLSGGQKQRIALARALYGKPVLVVLDEPNANLDESGEKALADTLRELKGRGCTVVLITHRAGVLAVTDRILALKDGLVSCFDESGKVLGALGGKPQPVKGSAYRQGFGSTGVGA